MKKETAYISIRRATLHLRVMVSLFFLLVYFSGNVFSKEYSKDSLAVFVHKHKHKVTPEVLDKLMTESKDVLDEDPRWARRQAEGILMLAKNKQVFGFQIGTANKLIGEAYSLENEFELSLIALKEAETWFSDGKNPEELAQVKNLMGICYQEMGDTKTAIALGFQALMVLERKGPDEYLASTLETLGNLFKGQKKYEEAQDYYLKALGIRQSLSDIVAHARTLLSIAHIEAELHNFQQAKDYNVLAIRRMQGREGSIYMAKGQQQLGYVLGKLGNGHEGIEELNKALHSFENIGNTVELAHTKTYLGEIHLQLGELEKAEGLVREAMGLAQDTDQKKLLLPIYKLWAEILSNKGLAQPAIYWYQKAYDLRDSLLRLEHMNHLTRVQADLALEKKDKENDKLKAQSIGHLRLIQFQKVTIVLFFGALLAILIMFLLVFKNRTMLKKAYEIQQKQKGEILLQANKLQEANEHISILNTQLEKKVERRSQLIMQKNRKLQKYAYDLSHNIRSPLSNVLGIIHLMKHNNSQAGGSFLDKLEASARQLDEVVRETNRSIEEGDL